MPKTEKLLIINADDAGLSDAVNDAVRKCYEGGAITGTSVMPCGEAFLEAASMLHDLGKTDVGVHLTLTGAFKPCVLTREMSGGILDMDGRFLQGYQAFTAAYFLKKININDIRRELECQINEVINEGLTVTHIDSHEHMHMFPKIFDITIELARKFNVNFIRVPVESAVVLEKDFSFKDLSRYAALKAFTMFPRKKPFTADVKSNDSFLGHFHAGRINDGVLSFMLDNLKGGVTELAVHPAVMTPGLIKEFPWHKNGENELKALLSGEWRERLKEEGVRLVTHREAVL